MQTLRVEIGLVMALLLVLASKSFAATYYVATDGAASNDGSSARPWPSVNHALAQVGGDASSPEAVSNTSATAASK